MEIQVEVEWRRTGVRLPARWTAWVPLSLRCLVCTFFAGDKKNNTTHTLSTHELKYGPAPWVGGVSEIQVCVCIRTFFWSEIKHQPPADTFRFFRLLYRLDLFLFVFFKRLSQKEVRRLGNLQKNEFFSVIININQICISESPKKGNTFDSLEFSIRFRHWRYTKIPWDRLISFYRLCWYTLSFQSTVF